MKFKLLKGIVYDICDSISCPPFHSVSLTKEKLPLKGKWIIDLKNNSAQNEKEKKIKLGFIKKYHDWFLKQIKKANIPLEKIDKAELVINFDLQNKKRPNWCSCTIKVGDKIYFYEKNFTIFYFVG